VRRYGASISVVIATYKRSRLLDECLAHLMAQAFEPGDEVVVVDNAEDEATAAVVANYQSQFPANLVLVREPRPGKSRAIATALSVAIGDVLAFTDDDVNVDGGWLRALREALEDPSIAMVGGPVLPRFEHTVPAWIRRAWTVYPRLNAPLALVDYGTAAIDLGPRTLLGANLAIRRAVFEQVGGFPAHLGKLHGTLRSGEDHALCLRVQAAGHRAVYWPQAVVRHWVPSSRVRASYFVNWFFWSGITNAVLEAQGAAPDGGIGGVPLVLFKRAAISSAAALAALAIGRRASALNHAIDVAFAAGYAAQRWRLRPTADPMIAAAGESA
jgi:GT2 family glycosyltransferase